jgi:hypothetical protein
MVPLISSSGELKAVDEHARPELVEDASRLLGRGLPRPALDPTGAIVEAARHRLVMVDHLVVAANRRERSPLEGRVPPYHRVMMSMDDGQPGAR